MRQRSLIIIGLAFGAIQFQLLASAQPETSRSAWSNAVVPGGDMTVEHGAFPTILGNYTHPGVDIGGGCDLPIILPTNGTVVRTYIDNDGVEDFVGNGLIVEHGSDLSKTGKEPVYTAYFHLKDPPTVDEGQVLRGHQVGQTGATGAAIGCHLHFEVRKFSETLNPKVGNIYLTGDQRSSELLIEDWLDPEAWLSEQAQGFWTVQPQPTLIVERGQEKNGFALSNKGEAFFSGQSLGQPIPSADQAVLHVYVSEDQEFAFVMQVDKYFGGLYGALVDLQSRRIIAKDAFNTFDYWGKYGSPSGMSWSPSGEWAAILVPYRDGQSAYILFSFLDGSSELILPGGSLASLDRWESNFPPRWWGSLSWLRSFDDVLEFGFGISEECHSDDPSCSEANTRFELTEKKLISNSAVSPQPAGRQALAEMEGRFPRLFAVVDQIADAATRETAKQAVLETLKFIGSKELSEKLIKFGLTPETAMNAAADAMERSLVSAGTDLASGIALSVVAEAGAKAFADSLFSAPVVRDLPKEWRTPLYALTAATVSEIVGGVVSVTEIPSKGPLVVLGPVLDRLYDAYEIYEASKGVAEAQNTTLYAIAMGAEVTAELAAKYPSERTDALVDLWKKDTVELVRALFSNNDAHEIRVIIEDAYQTLYYQKGSYLQDGAEEILRLQNLGPSREGPGAIAFQNPVEILVKVISRKDPVEVIRDAFLQGTSLSEITSKASADAGDWFNQAIPNVRLKPGERYGAFQYDVDGSILFQKQPLFSKHHPGEPELQIYLSPSRGWTYAVLRDWDRGGVESVLINNVASAYSSTGSLYRPPIFQSYPAAKKSDYCHFLHDGVAWSPREDYLAFRCLVSEGSSELGLLSLKTKKHKIFTPAWGVHARWGDPLYLAELKRTKDRWMTWGPDFNTLRIQSDEKLRVRFDRHRCAVEYSDADCWGGWEEKSYPVWESVGLPK